MKVVFFLASLVVYVAIHYGECQTIDEILEAAQNSPNNDDTDELDHPGDSNDVVIELDMRFRKDDLEEFQRESTVENHISRRRRKRKAARSMRYRWTDGTIPYLINNGFSDQDREEILQAIREWNDATCLNFRPKESSDSNYVYFEAVYEGCNSDVGMIRGPQSIRLAAGCRKRKTIAHELGHAIGFVHEQSRADRDQHVTIKWENIKAGKELNFLKFDIFGTNTYDIAYDYLSLMHYGKKYFSNGNGQPTIITKDPNFQERIGTAVTLSDRDIQLANTMYGCYANQQQEAPASVCNNESPTELCEFLKSDDWCADDSMRRNCKKTCGYCQ